MMMMMILHGIEQRETAFNCLAAPAAAAAAAA